MKLGFIIFFIVFIGIYALVNFYVFIRGWQALELFSRARIWYAIFFWCSASAFIFGRVLERFVQGAFTDGVVWYGSFWLGFLAYAFFIVLILDIGRFFLFVSGNPPNRLAEQYTQLKFFVGVGGTLLCAGILAGGFWNARTPVVKELSVEVPKEVVGKKDWNIVAVSDVHLGTLVNKKRAEALADSIMNLHPDLVLFVGDTVDEDVESVIRKDIGASLRRIQAPYGVFGITGNHEYIGGVEPSVSYLSEHGITMLRDSAVLVDDAFYLVGREDKSDGERKTLQELLSDIDASRPIVLLDHQPFGLNDAADTGRIDVQLSGHTHHGQLWPFNFITRMVYEVSWGYKKIGNTNFYISSGWGTWGPPIRTGNTPELVHLKLRFK